MKLFSNIFFWYFSRRALPYWCLIVLDCVLLFLSELIVYAFVKPRIEASVRMVGFTLVLYSLFYIIGFRLFRTYSGVIRYSSFIDLLKVGQATLFGMVLSIIFRYTFNFNDIFAPVYTREIILWSILATTLMWTMRVVVKFLYDSLFRSSTSEKAFIYGVKQGGVSIAKSLRNQDPAQYVVAGFISDFPEIEGRMLMGVSVYSPSEKVVDTMVKKGVKALFVSPARSESLRENEALVEALITAGIRIYMVPPQMQWDGHSPINYTVLREVDIEDLLPREQIQIDLSAVARQLSGQRILITGAAGSIGSEIARQVASFAPASLILIDQAETPLHDMRLEMQREHPDIQAVTIMGDITDRKRMAAVFAQYKPHYVFHAAAYKHVPMMEDNPAEAVHNNIQGTRVIADLAVEHGTLKFVMISTDKAVNPTNVMGCSKRICEIYVQSLDRKIKQHRTAGVTQFVTTRFGNVLGSNGSVIPLFKKQILQGGPITVTHPDIIRYFMLISEACKLVLEAGTMGNGGEIYVFDMGQPVKIVDLARRMIQLSGANIEIQFTGLRDGEKLYEEVLNDNETTLPTFHSKIKIARVREYDFDTVSADIDQLCRAAFEEDDIHIVRRMKNIVPEYISQHSRFSILD